MAYASPDDMRARFRESTLVQLADQGEWNATVEERLGFALGRATTVIDGFVTAIYSPAAGTAVPPLLRDLACDIAFYRLYEEPTEKAREDYKLALAQLRDIAAGKIKIDEGEVDAVQARPGAVLISDPGRVFSRARLEGF